MGNGTLRHEGLPYTRPVALGAEVGAARRHAPAHVRVAATLTADALGLVLSAMLAGWVGTALVNAPVVHRLFNTFDAQPAGGVTAFLLFTPYWLAALWAFGLYRESRRSIGGMNLSESLGGLTALTSASWLLLVLLVIIQGGSAPIGVLISFWAAAAVLVPFCRWVSRVTVWSRDAFQERVLIVGAGEVGHTLAAKMGKHREYRVKLVGFLDDGEPRRDPNGGPAAPVLGALDDLARVVAEQRIDRVIVAFARARHHDFLRVVRACADSNVQVNIVPRLFEVVSSRASVDDIEGIPLLDIAYVELGRFNMAAKRAFDLFVGSLVLVVTSPLLLAIALLVKIDSHGPVFYRQERMGRGGAAFGIYKFRSMYDGADQLRRELAALNDYSGPMFKMKRDPRTTRVGGFLRRWSLDELPQILNVVKGEMSLVGPRPLWVEEAIQCHGWTQKRLDITPGITGLWQVLGRSDIPFDEMVKLDYLYVTGWSMAWDVKLLLQTLPAVLRKRGAY